MCPEERTNRTEIPVANPVVMKMLHARSDPGNLIHKGVTMENKTIARTTYLTNLVGAARVPVVVTNISIRVEWNFDSWEMAIAVDCEYRGNVFVRRQP